jgi:hypothetical protein
VPWSSRRQDARAIGAELHSLQRVTLDIQVCQQHSGRRHPNLHGFVPFPLLVLDRMDIDAEQLDQAFRRRLDLTIAGCACVDSDGLRRCFSNLAVCIEAESQRLGKALRQAAVRFVGCAGLAIDDYAQHLVFAPE